MNINKVSSLENKFNMPIKANQYKRNISSDKDTFECSKEKTAENKSVQSFKGLIKRLTEKEPQNLFIYRDGHVFSLNSVIETDGCVIDMKNPSISKKLKKANTDDKFYIGVSADRTEGEYIGRDIFANDLVIADDNNVNKLSKIVGIIKKKEKGFIYYDRNSRYGATLNPSESEGNSKADKVKDYGLTRQQKSLYIANCQCLGVKPKDDKYVGFVLNNRTMRKYDYVPIKPGGYWSQPRKPYGDMMCAWKMHVFSDNTEDYIKMADILLPYLNANGINHKCMSEWRSPEDLDHDIQRGKAFTIYPSSIEQMEKTAKDLDYILKHHGLQRNDTAIAGDRQMGNSGRLFYRYELDSGKYSIDLFSDYNFYRTHYEANRSGTTDTETSHLASDMKITDDIWYNFDPADINSHPFIREDRKILLSRGQQSEINTKRDKIYLASQGENGYFLNLISLPVKEKIEAMRNGDIITIGRSSKCDIVVPPTYNEVSRFHGCIEKIDDRFMYRDNSTNGTIIVK